MKWKAAIVGPTGEVYTNTAAFEFLYAFPTCEEAEAHAECFLATGMKMDLIEQPEKPAEDSEPRKD